MTDIGCGRELFDGLCKRVEVVPHQRTERSKGLVARLAVIKVRDLDALNARPTGSGPVPEVATLAEVPVDLV